MSRAVWLLRHAQPAVRADQSPSQWGLTAAGRRAAVAIGDRLPDDAVLVSSPELKAIETLSAATGVDPAAIHLDARFAEVSRPGEPFDDDHRGRRLAWVVGDLDQRHRTWESPQAVADRFQSGLDDIEGIRPIVVASHGMIIAAWLSSIGYVAPGEPTGRLWSTLAFPDLVNVEVG